MAQNQEISELAQYLSVNTSSNAVSVNAVTVTLGNCVINSTSLYVNGVDYNPTTALAIAVALS